MKKMVTFLLVLVTVLSLTACGQTATSPDPSSNPDAVVGGFPQMEITIATTHPGNEQDPMYIYCKTFGDYVTEKTNGAVTFDISSDGVLGSDTEIAQGLAMGTLKMGITSNAAISTYEPSQNFFSLPFMFATASATERTRDFCGLFPLHIAKYAANRCIYSTNLSIPFCAAPL